MNLHPAPIGHVLLPEPDFGRPGFDQSGPDQRVVRPVRKGGRRGT